MPGRPSGRRTKTAGRSLAAAALVACVAALAIAGKASAHARPLLVPPDPEARAAFQRSELARYRALAAIQAAPADARSRLQDRYHVTHYRLAVDLRRAQDQLLLGDLTASVRVIAGPLDTLLLDLHDNMTVDSVTVDGAGAPFTLSQYDLKIFPSPPVAQGAVASVRVFYEGNPQLVGFDYFRWDATSGSPGAWTLSEPTGAREWWPCKDRPDDKADSVDVLIRVPAGLTGTSNGLLVGNTAEQDGSHTFHWRHRYPIATYLVCVNAAEFTQVNDVYVAAPGDTMPVEHFVYPWQVQAATTDFSITPEAIGTYARLFGPYPFLREKYGHTVFGWGGGMEHQTNTSIGWFLVQGNHQYDYIFVHELSHQWWGDMTSPADWRDVWLNEGFASYAEALWAEHLNGAAGLRSYMADVHTVTDPSGPIYNPRNLFDGNVVYSKGAWVLHMLRHVLGDSLFFASLGAYRDRTQYRSTTTAEFESIVEEASHRDLHDFFQSWVYGYDRPSYAVSFLPFRDDDGLPAVAVHLGQYQKTAPFFTLPVDLAIAVNRGGSVRARLDNDPDHQDIEIDVPARATGVTVDPDGWILKNVATAPYGLNITTTDLPQGHAGYAFSAAVHGRGGTSPYAWTAVDSLPAGIRLDRATGGLAGTPPDSGSFTFTLRLTDAAAPPDTDLQRYRWTVVPAPPDSGSGAPRGEWSFAAGPVPSLRGTSLILTGPAGVTARIRIYDIGGREVRDLWNGPAPSRAIPWDGKSDLGRSVSSGVYLARLQVPGRTLTRRVVLLR